MNQPNQDYGYPSSADGQNSSGLGWSASSGPDYHQPADPSYGQQPTSANPPDPGYGYSSTPPPAQPPQAAPPAPASSQWPQPTPVNQQPTGQPPGNQPMGQQPTGQQSWDYGGYPQAENPSQGYPLSQYTQWANVPAPIPVAPARQQSSRGFVALGLALAALGISLILTVWGGQSYAEAWRLSGGNLDNIPPAADDAYTSLGFSVILQILPSVLGLIGLIMGITAVRTTSRGAAIGAIIVAVLAPLVSFMLFVVMVASVG